MRWPIVTKRQWKRYQRGRKSTSIETTELVYDAQDDDYYASWVYPEELDRRAVRDIPQQYAAVRRLIATARAS